MEFRFSMRVCENNENAFSHSHFPRFLQFVLLREVLYTVGRSLFPIVTPRREGVVTQTYWGSRLYTRMETILILYIIQDKISNSLVTCPVALRWGGACTYRFHLFILLIAEDLVCRPSARYWERVGQQGM